MKISASLIVFCLLAGCVAGAARADDINLFTPLSAFVIDDPHPPSHGEKVPTYSPTGPAPSWHISQWVIPGGDLPAFTRQRQPGGTLFVSQAAEASVRIMQAPTGTSSLALSQDGSVLPCLTDAGKPYESDLLAAPSGPHPLPPSRSGSTQPGGISPPLSQMSALIQSITVKVSTGTARHGKGCAVNQGSALLALIVQEKITTPPQTLFYQLSLHGLCGPGTPQRRQACLNAGRAMAWFFRANPYGVGDTLALAGGGDLPEGSERHIVVDLLPRLTQAIANAPATMDHDISHWRVVGGYFGQNIWGDVSFNSAWRDYRVVAQTNSAASYAPTSPIAK